MLVGRRGGGRTFQSRTRAPGYDGGGVSYDRGAQYGIQFGYSIGFWDDDVLTIWTKGIKEGLDPPVAE